MQQPPSKKGLVSNPGHVFEQALEVLKAKKGGKFIAPEPR